MVFSDVDEAMAALASDGYLVERRGAVAVYLALAMGKPLLVEGPAGVGEDGALDWFMASYEWEKKCRRGELSPFELERYRERLESPGKSY